MPTPIIFIPLLGKLQGQSFIEIVSTAGLMKVSGIYAILHRASGRVYVGSASSIKSRISYHRSKLRNNKHDNSYLQNSWNKYGESAFVILLLEMCPPSELLLKEGQWMNTTGCCDKTIGFNLDVIAIRKMHCDETKRKMSIASKGRPKTEEHKRKLAIAKTGKKLAARSEETNARYRAYRKSTRGYTFSEASRKKMSKSRMGRIITPEWRNKIRTSILLLHANKRKEREKCQLSLFPF